MLDLVNPNNVQRIYDGLQSVPSPYGHNGYEILVRGKEGQIESSQFQGVFDEKHFKDDRLYHFVLEIPDEVKMQIGAGRLVIELEVDIRQAEDWEEEVQYLAGHGYRKQHGTLSWERANAYCKDQGKNLASVKSKWELDQVNSITSTSVWLGGTDVEKEGEWKWSDGSSFGFTNWGVYSNYGNLGLSFNCLQNFQERNKDHEMLGKWHWKDEKCSKIYQFICQDAKKTIQAPKKKVWRYTREQIAFSSFQVWYKLKAANQSQIEAWKDQRMTGFSLRWSIDNTPMTLTSSEVGRAIITPNLGGSQPQSDYFEKDRSFIVRLMFPKALKDQIGKGQLVIQVEADMHEGEGWCETLTYTGEAKNFTLFDEKKTWHEAEAYCQNRGGHLASIISLSEGRLVFDLAAGELDMFLEYPDAQDVWVGGSDQDEEGSWKWSDGSSWILPNLATEYGSYEDGRDCLAIDPILELWTSRNCSEKQAFVCERRGNVMRGMDLKNLTFTQDQLNFPALVVGYTYKAAKKDVFDAWVNKRVTGFRLNWFIQDINGTKLTETLPARTHDWKSLEVSSNYTDDLLNKSVQLANQLRQQNMTQEDMVTKVVQEITHIKKEGVFNIGYLEDKFCSPVQSLSWQGYNAVNVILDILIDNETTNTILIEDLKAGFAIYSAVVFCSNTPKQLYKFFFDLVSKEAPRTILLALVNTIRSSSLKTYADKLQLNEFYHSLNLIMKPMYAQIITAISSRNDLKKMNDNGWPFFSNKTEMFLESVQSDHYQNVSEPTDTLGN